MIEEQARVAGVDRHLAEIVIEKQSACGSCSARSGCGTSLLSAWFAKRQRVIRLNNDIGARPGDRVMLGLDETRLQRSALLLYAFPLAGLLVGSVVGERASAFLGLPAELGAVLMGLSGLAAALFYVRHLSATRLQRTDGGLRLLRVLDGSRPFAAGDVAIPKVNQSEGFGTGK